MSKDRTLWRNIRDWDLKQVRMEQIGNRKKMMENLRLAREAKMRAENSADVKVMLQVRDFTHARSAEVLSFCLDHLGSGGTWDHLRRKLGLGPSDARWRIIRERAVEGLLPINEEEALKAVGSQRSFLVQKLEQELENLEARMESLPEITKIGVVDHHFWKIKVEIMKILLDENSKDLGDHLEMKKAKAADKQALGQSIIVQNNYYIPRPGDSQEKIRDVVPLLNEIAEKKVEVEALIADSKKLQADEESTPVPR